MSEPARGRALGLRIAMLIVAALLPYARLPSVPLFPDAERAVTRNPAIAQSTPGAILHSDFWGLQGRSPAATGSYRPIVSLTYWIERRCFGSNLAALHLFDMLLHALGATLVFAILQRIASRGPFAFGAALLFAVHPALSEAVCSVVGRADLLAGTSLLAAWLLHRRAVGGIAPRRSDAAALSLLGVALLSKEYAVAFPFVIAIGDLVVGEPGSGRAQRNGRRFWALSGVLLLGYLGLRYAVLGSFGDVQMVATSETPLASLPLATRCANALWLLLPALRVLCFPSGLDHVWGVGTVGIATSLASPRALAGVVFVIGAAGAGLWNWRRRGDGTPLLAFVIFVLPLLPALNIVGVTVLLFAERFLYVPAVGFVMMLAWSLRRTATTDRMRRIVMAGVVVVAVGFAVLTARRVEDWRSNESLARTAVRAHPHNALALHELGMALAQRGQYEEAARLVRASLQVYAPRPAVWKNYAMLLDRLARRDEALEAWRQAVQGLPAGMGAPSSWLVGFATAAIAAGHPEAAVATLDRAVVEQPNNVELKRVRARLHSATLTP